MPDIFDQVDTSQAAPSQTSVSSPSGDIFDQVSPGNQGDIFDQMSPDQPPGPALSTPATDAALSETIEGGAQSREAMRPRFSGEYAKQHPYFAGAAKAITGIIPKSWEDVKQMTTLPRPAQPVDVEKENRLGAAWRGEYGPEAQAEALTGTALQALPLLDVPFAKSPLRASPADLALVSRMRDAQAAEAAAKVPPPIPPQYLERRFEMVPQATEAPTTLQPAPPLEQTVTTTGAGPEPHVSPETGFVFPRERETQIGLPSETARIGGETDATRIESTGPIPELEVRPRLGEEAPLRGEPEGTPGAQEPVPSGEPVAPAVQTQPDAPELAPSGISTERLQDIYGKDAVVITQGKGAKAWQAIGEADKRDPYAVLTKARRTGIATPEDTAKLRNEHQKLLSAARQTYGTPAYPQLAQYAADFGNAMKTVAHGPASDVMRALQEADQPKYDSPADFDSIMRDRWQRESTPEQTKTFTKVSDELRNGDQEVKTTAADAQQRLKRYLPKEEVSFNDAVDHVRDQIKKLTEPCEL